MGTKLVMPGPKLDGASVYELLSTEKVTYTAGVPTVWLMLLQYMATEKKTLPDLKVVICGGSAMPRSMIKAFADMGVEPRHAWGMTEMSPIGTVGALKPPFSELRGEAALDILQTQGYPPFGVQMKITDDAGKDLPWGRQDFRRLKVRRTIGLEGLLSSGHQHPRRKGFFDTGDVATIDADAYMRDHRPLPRTSSSLAESGFRRSISRTLQSGTPRCWKPRSSASIIRMGRAPAADRAAQARAERQPRRDPAIHGRQDREVVDAGRRAVRGRHSAHRHRQDPETALRDQFKNYAFPTSSG